MRTDGQPPTEEASVNRKPSGTRREEPAASEMRFLFYSHDGVGLGHVRRNLAIAAAVTELDPSAAILIATSADEIEDLGVPPGADVLKLPGLAKVANDAYAARRLPLPSTDVRGLRASLLAAAVDSFEPTVMVVDKHPLGIGGELRTALETLRRRGGKAVLGLRDILDDPATVADEWTRHDLPRQIHEHYDRLLVYGTPAVFNTVREYALPPQVSRMARYAGYVARRAEAPSPWEEPPRPRSRPLVLASAGGGNDGFNVLAAFIAAAKGMPWDAVVVSGRQATRDEQEGLAYLAELAGVSFRPFVPALASWFPAAAALVCMGGYNTLVEALAAGLPTVSVPRTTPRTEQLIRTSAFARLGLLRMLTPDQLRPDRLRAALCAALGTPRTALAARVEACLDLRGADTAARELLELAIGERPTATPALVGRGR